MKNLKVLNLLKPRFLASLRNDTKMNCDTVSKIRGSFSLGTNLNRSHKAAVIAQGDGFPIDHYYSIDANSV